MISKNQIKQIGALHIKKFRDSERSFIAEGIKVVDEVLLNDPEIIRELYCTEDYARRQPALSEKKIRYTVVTEDELKKISALTTPNNVLAVCSYFKEEKIKTDLSTQFSFYLDDIRDPGNLGTILRIADWFGVKEIFCSPQSTDLYNPKTIQAAMGAFLRVRVHYIALGELLHHRKFPVYGAVLDGENIYRKELQNGLIIIGNEANGISASNMKFITDPVTIPAHARNETESLNAAMATAIICGEFFRQLGQ